MLIQLVINYMGYSISTGCQKHHTYIGYHSYILHCTRQSGCLSPC